MPLIIPTISRLQTATTCNASVVLEQLADGPPSPSAKRGSLIGAVIASHLRGWPMPDVGKHRLKINMEQLRAYLGDGDIRCEAAMSMRPDGSVEDLGENLQRSYERPGCINGAADIVVVRNHALCIDVKSGSYPVPDPVDNWQVAGLAGMLARVIDCETITGVVAKLGRDGEWDFGRPRRWNHGELAAVRFRLKAKLVEWQETQALYDAGLADPERVQNTGCFFCRTVCEYGRNAQREAA